MAQRGRGCLEIRDSTNPFFTTSNASIGTSASVGQQQQREFDAPTVFKRKPTFDPVAAGIDWSFMYTKRRVPGDKGTRDALLAAYNHTPKEEHALYSTTNNDIGIKRPTGATFTFERRARQQGFRRVFHNSPVVAKHAFART
eukprot:jgi/Undpi1/1888/HiC_scaffold_12.g05275.m1